MTVSWSSSTPGVLRFHLITYYSASDKKNGSSTYFVRPFKMQPIKKLSCYDFFKYCICHTKLAYGTYSIDTIRTRFDGNPGSTTTIVFIKCCTRRDESESGVIVTAWNGIDPPLGDIVRFRAAEADDMIMKRYKSSTQLLTLSWLIWTAYFDDPSSSSSSSSVFLSNEPDRDQASLVGTWKWTKSSH